MTVMPWRRLWRDINRDPRFTTLDLGHRTLYTQLLVELDDDGYLPPLPDVPLVDHLADVLHIPHRVVSKGLPKLVARGLVLIDQDQLRVPKFPSRQGLDTETEHLAQMGPKTQAERAKAYRERRRQDAGAESNSSQPSHDDRDASRDVRDVDRDDSSRPSRDVTKFLPHSPSSKDKDLDTDREGEGTRDRDASRDVRDVDRDDSSSPKGDSAPTAKSKTKRPKPTAPDPTPPLPGTPARAIYDFIVGDAYLAPITDAPADFAARVADSAAYPGVNVAAEIRHAAEWAVSKGKGHTDGRAFLRGWLKRAAEDAARKPKPAARATQAAPPSRVVPPEPRESFAHVPPEGISSNPFAPKLAAS